MEYAIPIVVVAVFIAVYLITRPKIRATYFDVYDSDTYKTECEKLVRSLPLPKEGGKTDAKRYASTIKRIMRKIKMRRYSGFFDKFADVEDEIKSLLKTDFTALDELPSISGEPRAVKLARFCLARSDYVFNEDRLKTLLDEHNRRKTLSYSEITAMNKAFIYVLIEKLVYVYLQLETLAKIYMLSAKYVYNPVLLDGKYKKLTKSRLFLSICALQTGYKMEFFTNVHSEVTDSLRAQITNLLSTVKEVKSYDFSRYYTPLEILDTFEVFSDADAETKSNFLKLIKEASDEENLDEFMYTVRLEKYMKSASAGHLRVRRWSLMSRTLCFINHKRDITMLATALSSKHFMNLYFAPTAIDKKHKYSKSISKLLEFENTFEPIYKFHIVNFGISTSGGKLRVAPALPKQIERADVVFDVNGVKNTLHIERGPEKEMYIGGTRLTGVEQIKLGSNPLDITVKIPKD